MNDDVRDLRFERDLRAVLAEGAPADAPAALYDFVADVPRLSPSHGIPAWRLAFMGLAAAAAVVVAVTALALSLQSLDHGVPVAGEPTPTPGPSTIQVSGSTLNIQYQVQPLDGKAPTADGVQSVADVMRGRLLAATGWDPVITITGADTISV